MLIAKRLLMVAALIIVCVSIAIDQWGAGPDTLVCRAGLCRKDQLLRQQLATHPDGQMIDLLRLRRLVRLAPADAYAWAGLAEQLRMSGLHGEAGSVLDRAVELAPAVAQIRMRRVNLCFENGDKACLLRDGRVVLSKTALYDGVLFSYYKTLGISLDEVLSLGLPDEARSARAWAIHLAKGAPSTADALSTWVWLRNRGHADESTACRMTRDLVNRRQFEAAWRIWRDFRTHASRQTGGSNLITNSTFDEPLADTPFDWELRPEPGVRFILDNGLDVIFEGTANLSMQNVRQLLFLQPGPHRMIVDLEYEGLTTDQGPYLRLYGEGPDAAWSVQTGMFKGSAPRVKIEKDFVVTGQAGPAWLQVQRAVSEKSENRISGKLRIHAITLIPLNVSAH